MKISKFFSVLTLFVIIGCDIITPYNMEFMEEFSGMKLKGKVKFVKRFSETYGGLQPDETVLLIFDIKREYTEEIITEVERKHWESFEIHNTEDIILDLQTVSFKDKAIPYFENAQGYYKEEFGKNEVKTIFFDRINHRIIYYYIFI